VSSHNEYPAPGREVTPDDLTRFLIPDSPASLTGRPEATEAAPERPAIPSTEALLAAWQQQQHAAALVQSGALLPQSAALAVPEHEPIVPRWVWRASAVTAAVSAMAGVIGFVVWGVSLALNAAVSAVSAAAPYLGVGVVALVALALLCRRRPEKDTLSVKVVQSVVVQSKRK
jgi:MYXO-CTERM domain-containing protein